MVYEIISYAFKSKTPIAPFTNNGCNYLSMLGLKLIHVSKGGPRRHHADISFVTFPFSWTVHIIQLACHCATSYSKALWHTQFVFWGCYGPDHSWFHPPDVWKMLCRMTCDTHITSKSRRTCPRDQGSPGSRSQYVLRHKLRKKTHRFKPAIKSIYVGHFFLVMAPIWMHFLNRPLFQTLIPPLELVIELATTLFIYQLQSSAVITRINLSRYYIRHCDNNGGKWIRY